MLYRSYLILAASLLALAACETSGPAPASDADVASLADARLADAAIDAGPASIDAAGADAAGLPDGVPVRRACTSNFGQGLTAVHGRLDGTLVSIVEPGAHGCNADSGHVHLQVEMQGATYDVAINVESAPDPVQYLARDLPLPDGAWSEGWHTGASGSLDYPSLGLHAADFTPMSQAALVSTLADELAQVNHISVFMIGYGPDGGHNVHRVGTFQDGALVLRPLSAAPRLLFFHFADQTF